MPKNSKGGKKFKKGKKEQTEKVHMVYKEDGEDYAKVIKALGAGRLHAILQDGTQLLCIIPGKMKKKKWIKVGDIILINIREYQKDKADVLHCYNESQLNILKSQKCLPNSFIHSLGLENNEINDNIIFTNDVEDSIDTQINVNTLKDKDKDITNLLFEENSSDLEEEINIEDI